MLKTGLSGSTYYIYDEDGRTIGEFAQGNSPVIETVYLGNLPIAVLTPKQYYYMLADHIDTPLVVAQMNGTVVWDWRNRDAFGNSAPLSSPEFSNFNNRFPGQIADVETGLFYNYFRDYDPRTGQYIESDLIGLGGGINTYSYVSGNPVSGTDLLGLVRQLDPKGQECTALREKIARKKQDINKRIQECRSNPQDLPYYPPYPGAPPRMSVQGHEDLIRDLKDTTADDEALYAQKCGGGSGGSPALNSIPQSSQPATSDAGKAAATVGGLGVTYWIISEGLRIVFPPRNLIPIP